MASSRMGPKTLLLWAILLSPNVGAELLPFQLGQAPKMTAKELGGFQWGSLPETERLALREQAGWRWEFPNEPAPYRERQEAREEEIMDLYHMNERLDNWVQFVQTRITPNFTKNGFDVVQAPKELTERLQKRLNDTLAAGPRKEGSVPLGILGATNPDFIHHGERDILNIIKPIHEKWAPAAGPLKASASYGIRIYRRDNSLAWHADRIDTHVISSIYHIGHHYDNDDEPWPIEIEGHDGERHSVALEPGQMLMYESAKCPHGRSTALKGDYYAAIFSHFMPVSSEVWPYTQQDVWIAVPPGWDASPVAHEGIGRWAGAFLTHDSMYVAGMVDRTTEEMRMREVPSFPSVKKESKMLCLPTTGQRNV